MAITKDKKNIILEKLQKVFSDAKSIAFVNFHGLNVFGATNLRKHLRGNNVGYFVAKKTLIRKALEGKNVSGSLPSLEGEVGVAWSSDLTAPAREVHSFGKTLEQGLKLIGGIFEGKFLGKEDIMSIALIPSRKTLEAQFVNLINSPIQRLAVALDQISKKKS
jgi:large subunit ribosomal protein L10